MVSSFMVLSIVVARKDLKLKTKTNMLQLENMGNLKLINTEPDKSSLSVLTKQI